MAKQLSNEEAEELVLSNSSFKKYPWNTWMDGNWWHVQEHIDFVIKKESFRNMVYRKQHEYGKISTVEMPDGFLIKNLRGNNVSES
jgi:hypothetical protein